MLDDYSKLAKSQIAAIIISGIANFVLFIATVTPAWQVAEDKDAGRYVQSGLWIYCPGATQCWYVFSDDAVNYYERADVCRFLLIYDCRKKLLRTPYFFSWHYIVLWMNIFSMGFCGLAVIAGMYGFCRKDRNRLAVIFMDGFLLFSSFLLSIALVVFMTNAEMLESKYLIGIRNTYEKQYGYSFYLGGFALLIMLFAMLAAVMVTTYTFFHIDRASDEEMSMKDGGSLIDDRYYQNRPQQPIKAIPPGFRQEYLQGGASSAASSIGFQTPLRAGTPLSTLPPLNVNHGEYIPGARSPNGEFTPTTRHFYSY